MAKTYTLGEEMKAYRGREGLTQRQLGELLGVKQVDISRFENGRKEPPPEVEAAFKCLPEKRAEPEPEPEPKPPGGAAEILISFLAAARQEMGRPMEPDEEAALSRAKHEELLSESVLTREALEVQASRELLSGAKAFRAKQEAARGHSGRKGG